MIQLTAAVFQVIIGVIILNRASKNQISNLRYLGLHVLIQAGVFAVLSIPIIPYYINIPIIASAYVSILYFVKITFYKDVKSQFVLVMILTLALSVFLESLAIIEPYPPQSTNTQLNAMFNLANLFLGAIPNFWCARANLRQYNAFKNRNIEDWIKKRYLIGGLSHLSWGCIGIGIMIGGASGFVPFIYSWILATILIFTIGVFIAWVMPGPLKRYFNRNYKAIDEGQEMTEEELMNISLEAKS